MCFYVFFQTSFGYKTQYVNIVVFKWHLWSLSICRTYHPYGVYCYLLYCETRLASHLYVKITTFHLVRLKHLKNYSLETLYIVCKIIGLCLSPLVGTKCHLMLLQISYNLYILKFNLKFSVFYSCTFSDYFVITYYSNIVINVSNTQNSFTIKDFSPQNDYSDLLHDCSICFQI